MRHNLRSAAITCVFAALAALPAMRASAAASLPTAPCKLEDIAEPARCGELEVLENPNQPKGRRLKVHFAVLPATSGKALPDPIVAVLGGPGEDAIGAAAYFAKRFTALRADRDLLFVDQRGTGQSGALHCSLYSPAQAAANLRDLFPVAAVKRCERELQTHADLTQYGYLRFAHDLEQVRRALGYSALNLSGGSYGTRAAVVYMRAYPKSVRTAYLGSVVPIDLAQPLPMAATAQSTMDDLFKVCAADSVCNAAFPNFSVEFREVFAQLKAGVRVSIPGRTEQVPLDAGRVAEWFRSRLYRPAGAAQLPWLVHQAHAGNWTPIVDGILSDSQGADSDLSLGLLFAITCNEDVPFLNEQEIASKTRGTFLGDYRVRQQQAACQAWPRWVLPAGYREPVRSAVPTMFVSGDADGATPLWFMDHVATGFSASIKIVARGQGHTEWSDCIAQHYKQFVTTVSVRELKGASCETVPRPPFKTS